MNNIIKDSLAKSISYTAYRKKVSDLLAEGKSTGPVQSEDLLNYSTLNDARMNRLDKKVTLTETTINALKRASKQQTWLLITEGWCGDAAQITPVIHKMSEVSDTVDLKIVLRDENEALMNEFLTNGSKSIPKLVVLNEQEEVISSWGPRPSVATKMVNDYKEQHGGLDADFKRDLQVWYNKDKGQSIQEDLIAFLEN
ncbi:MAG: thioredoxin family protein [Flavobacteriaceae bacterium]|nr:thioredoxin family protein [Flavobacteriaceae bacterium]